MIKLASLIGAMLSIVMTCSAQHSRPVPAPDDLALSFKTQGDGHLFHVGEAIPIEYEYTAVAGRYIYVDRYERLIAGRQLEITCTPHAEPARSETPGRSSARFAQMLIDSECMGDGGGVGSGCGDCDGETPVGKTPLNFIAQLNQYVRFRQPGTYACTASSAQVTSAPRGEQLRNALLTQSNPVELRISDDPGWAHAAAVLYASTFEKNCRNDHLEGQRLIECFDASARLTYLDTPESLASIIRFFNGKQQSWGTGFWEAIQATSHQDYALHLMTIRIQEPDMQVSTSVLTSLAMWALQAEAPDSFNSNAPASSYHSQALDQLRKYVRILGSSLRNKKPDALDESVKTYRTIAERQSCSGDLLIPEAEKSAALLSAQVSGR